MRILKKAISALLAVTIIFSFNILSMAYPELSSVLSDIFSVKASAIDEKIMQYAPEGTQDFALKATVTASSSYSSADGKWHLDRINDGSFTYNGVKAGFSTATNETTDKDASKYLPLTLIFDLEGYYDVSRIALFKHGSFPNNFTISTSLDGNTYDEVSNQTGKENLSQEALAVDIETKKARFVKIEVTERGKLDGNSIHLVQFGEIAIYGKPVAATNDNLDIHSYAPEHCINIAQESTVTAPNCVESSNGTWSKENINDGNTAQGTGFTTDAGTGINDEFNIDFNFGYIAHVKRLVFFPFGCAPHKIEIQVSFDGMNYTTVKSKTISEKTPSEPIVIELDKFASYVRFHIDERYPNDNEPCWYAQCAELAIYGIKNVFDAEVNKTNVNLLVNDTLQLEWEPKRNNGLFYTFFNYDFDIKWSSSNTSYATVDNNGLVAGKAKGVTTITAANETLDYSATVEVNVYEELPYKRDNFTISVFSPPKGDLFTDEQYQRIKKADIDLLINSYNFSTPEENLALLEMAGKYGINTIVSDNRFWNEKENISQELVDEVYADYKGISNLEGVYLYDEPWNGNIFVDSANRLADAMPGSFVSLNYFPGFIYNSYEQYEYTFDDLAALTNGKVDLMFDVYPFEVKNVTQYQRMFDSLEAIRRSGLKYDINTAACMQTHGYGPAGKPRTHRNPSQTDMLYQGMTYIAYGIKHLSYWKYSSSEPGGTEDHDYGAIDLQGNTTSQYTYMEAVNPTLRTVGNRLYNCDAKEVYLTGTNLYGQKAVPSDFFVQATNSSQNLIFSYLQDKDTGRNYLMVVNNNLSSPVDAGLKFESGIDHVYHFNNNTGAMPVEYLDSNNSITVNIVAGGAALFALPENYRYGEQPEETKGDNALYHKTVYGNSSLGTPGTRDDKLPGWYLSCLTDGYIEASKTLGLNGWCSELKDASFETEVKIDLGESKKLSSITLHAVDAKTGYYNYFPKLYVLQGSVNGETWTNLTDVTNAQPNNEGYVTHPFTETDMRYVRLQVKAMNSVNGKYAAALAEITASEVAEDGKGKVALIVPEVIYLHPVSNSWSTSTTSTFHYYIHNSFNPNDFYDDLITSTSIDSEGMIYFAAKDGFSNVSLSKRFIDSSGNTLGNSITVSDGELFSADDTGLVEDFYRYKITGGTSPSLNVTTTGCYIEWTLTYTNDKNERQSVIAYTYVYKPYVVPQTTGVRVANNYWDDGAANHISWVTGFHFAVTLLLL